MIDINKLRRLAQAATPGGWYVEHGNYVYGCKDVTDGEEEWHPVIACTDDDEPVNFDGNAAFIAAVNPAAISELLDRLEAAESDALEQARLNGMGGEREAALLAKLEAAEKERDALRSELSKQQSLTDAAQQLAKAAQRRADKLSAKVERMEKQVPAYWGPKHAIEGSSTTVIVGKFPVNPTDTPLYALPGAKGE